MRTKTGSLGRMGTALAVALAVCSAVEIGLLVFRPASVALAQGGGTRTVTHTNFQDFDVCTVLPETVPRSYADTVASSADGGEIRLAAYVEDYFEDPGISATRWVTYLHDSGRLDRPAIVDGVYRTSNGGIRSQLTVPANRRVVDMRARLQEPGGSTGWGDLWFGRTILPGYSIPDQDQANRLFITDASGGVSPPTRAPVLPPLKTFGSRGSTSPNFTSTASSGTMTRPATISTTPLPRWSPTIRTPRSSPTSGPPTPKTRAPPST
jgi:hypothetical protein